MAYRLRIEYPGATYHIFNRGNYRRDIFASPGASDSFHRLLFEATARFNWILFAFALMRNHYHLATMTPEPNLAVGMQWLQSTFATRFNRFRRERGHLFQGRYHAVVLESGGALANVVNYIHLNPVKANITDINGLASLPTTSLFHYIGNGIRPAFLKCEPWMETLNFSPSRDGWRSYLNFLAQLTTKGTTDGKGKFGDSHWALGTPAFRQQLAVEKSRPLIPRGRSESREARSWQWAQVFREEMARAGRTVEELGESAKGADWKVAVAFALRQKTTATNAWIARELQMGAASSVAQYLSLVRRGRISILEA